jgi:predicted negative regulator of RcsB-dependent stress response
VLEDTKKWLKDNKTELLVGIILGLVILLGIQKTAEIEKGVGESCCQQLCKAHNMTCWGSSNEYVRCFEHRGGAGYQQVVSFYIYDAELCCE